MKNLVSWQKELDLWIGDSDWDYYCYDRLDSTMDQAKYLLLQKKKTNLLVLAQSQKMARGRLGKEWQTTSGALAATFVLPVNNIDYGALPLIVGLLLLQIINDPENRLIIKWPNDILTTSQDKIAGILVEQFRLNEVQYLSIGIGMNLESKGSNLVSASLYEAVGIAYHPCELAGKIALKLPLYLSIFQEKGFMAFFDLWNKYTFPKGAEIEAIFDQEKIIGVYNGVDPFGRILVTINNEECSFSSLEISKVRYVSS